MEELEGKGKFSNPAPVTGKRKKSGAGVAMFSPLFDPYFSQTAMYD